MATNTIILRKTWIVATLGATALLLMLASVVSQQAVNASDHKIFEWLSELLLVDVEGTIPTAFSSLMLLFASLLLAVIALLKHKHGDAFVMHWSVLALGFLAMAVDEAMSFHERLVNPMRTLLGNEDLGVFYFAWVLPGIVLVLVLGVFFARFLWRLPKRTAGLFVLAAALYLGGAIVLELAGGLHAERFGMESGIYRTISTVEEGLEMAGVVVYIWALLTYLEEHYGAVEVKIVAAPLAAEATAAPAPAARGHIQAARRNQASS